MFCFGFFVIEGFFLGGGDSGGKGVFVLFLVLNSLFIFKSSLNWPVGKFCKILKMINFATSV